MRRGTAWAEWRGMDGQGKAWQARQAWRGMSRQGATGRGMAGGAWPGPERQFSGSARFGVAGGARPELARLGGLRHDRPG